MFEDIQKGMPPSKLFRELVASNPALVSFRLALLFGDEFEKLLGEAQQVIWHRKGPGEVQGLNDMELDAILLRLMREAGYL
ncbi:hypothetical protein [Achromobacter piechaudii]|uniref:hypothetical protein n=1 Tax=Achromobacter piechaudii TaxID=72556 RepID=UPI003DA7D29E